MLQVYDLLNAYFSYTVSKWGRNKKLRQFVKEGFFVAAASKLRQLVIFFFYLVAAAPGDNVAAATVTLYA